MENETDAPFGVTAENSTVQDVSAQDAAARPEPATAPELSYYDMTGEKYLHIFNHYKYQSTIHFRYNRPSERTGTVEDVKRLTKVFMNMNYKVKTYQDLDYSSILDTVKNISHEDHETTACLCMAFLTHGERGGELLAADRPYALSDVTALLERGHAALVGKPKILFLQACRGGEVDDGRRVQIDGGEISAIIPTQADFLVLYSTVEEYVAYRDTGGSFLIQELCNVVEEYHMELDILHIATLVQMRVAYFRSTFAPKKLSIHNKKQMPETRYTLTKLFKFI